MTTKRPRRLNRIPRERDKIMEAVFQGALAVIRKHKALAEAEAKQETPKLRIQPRKKPTL